MLHRFLLRGCRRGHAASVCWVSISVWTFAVLGSVPLAFYLHWERENEQAETFPRLALCTRFTPWSYRLWCLAVCLSVCLSPGSWSQVAVLPAYFSFPLPFFCVLFSCRPRNFVDCDCDFVLCFSRTFSFSFYSRSLSLFGVLVLSSCNQKSIIDAFGPKTLWGQPQHLCIEPEPERRNTPMTLVDKVTD